LEAPELQDLTSRSLRQQLLFGGSNWVPLSLLSHTQVPSYLTERREWKRVSSALPYGALSVDRNHDRHSSPIDRTIGPLMRVLDFVCELSN